MGATAAGVTFIASLIVALAVAYRPLGDYMYRVVTSAKHWRVHLLRFLIFGSGEVAPVTREVLREAEPDLQQRPFVHVA